MVVDLSQTVSEEMGRLSEQNLGEEQVPFLRLEPQESSRHTSGGRSRVSFFTTICFAASITLFLGAIWREPSDAECVRKLNAWSPMLEAIQYREQNFGRLSDSPFVGTPSDDMEAAWDELWKFGSMGLHEIELPLLNKSVTDYDWHYLHNVSGGGIQAYIEGFHYIHCLNLVRQYIYRNQRDYSYISFFTNKNITILEHTEHCIEMLRAKILCESDTAMYPLSQGEISEKTIEMPIDQQCRDFEAAVNWANDHITVPVEH